MSLIGNEELDPILIALMVIAIVLYLWGVYFHLKIIQVSKKDKDLTWKLDIANSIIVMFIYLQSITMHCITYIIRDLYIYTGQWFCYIFEVIAHYSNFYLWGHSLIISLTKYTIIVYWQKAREWGNEKVVMLYLFINMIHPVISLFVWFCIRPDFLWASDATAHIDRRLGDPKHIWVDNFERPIENASLTKLHNLCQIAAPTQQDHIQYIINLIRASTCWIHVGFYYGYASNLFEMVVYCRIFVFMRR